MKNCDENKTCRNQNRIPISQSLNHRCIFRMSCSNRLKRRLETVRQVQTKQNESNHIKNDSPKVCEFCVKFAPKPRHVTCVAVAGNVFVHHFVRPKIIHVQTKKCQNHQSRNNHISRHPRGICGTVVHGVFTGLALLFFISKTKPIMKWKNTAKTKIGCIRN